METSEVLHFNVYGELIAFSTIRIATVIFHKAIISPDIITAVASRTDWV